MHQALNQWFSAAIDVECFALHSPLDRIKPVKAVKAIMAKSGDQSKTFCSQAPIHVINRASLRDLQERVLQRYADKSTDDFSIDEVQYRPNIVFDSDKPWSEDEYVEMRIDRCFFRFIGPTGRCPYVYQNWSTAESNPNDEPLTTLRTFRMMKQGFAALGSYY